MQRKNLIMIDLFYFSVIRYSIDNDCFVLFLCQIRVTYYLILVLWSKIDFII